MITHNEKKKFGAMKSEYTEFWTYKNPKDSNSNFQFRDIGSGAFKIHSPLIFEYLRMVFILMAIIVICSMK